MRIQNEPKVLALSIILLLAMSAAITIIPGVLAATTYTQMPDRDTHTEVGGKPNPDWSGPRSTHQHHDLSRTQRTNI